MKELENYCVQKSAYQDSFGKCTVQLEPGETVADIREKYLKPLRAWYLVHYSNLVKLDAVVVNGVTYTGEIYQMDTRRAYLD